MFKQSVSRLGCCYWFALGIVASKLAGCQHPKHVVPCQTAHVQRTALCCPPPPCPLPACCCVLSYVALLSFSCRHCSRGIIHARNFWIGLLVIATFLMMITSEAFLGTTNFYEGNYWLVPAFITVQVSAGNSAHAVSCRPRGPYERLGSLGSVSRSAFHAM